MALRKRRESYVHCSESQTLYNDRIIQPVSVHDWIDWCISSPVLLVLRRFGNYRPNQSEIMLIAPAMIKVHVLQLRKKMSSESESKILFHNFYAMNLFLASTFEALRNFHWRSRFQKGEFQNFKKIEHASSFLSTLAFFSPLCYRSLHPSQNITG